MTVNDEDNLLDLEEDLGDAEEFGGESESSDGLLENIFGVDEDGGKITMSRRPAARLEVASALNLAAWIVACADIELEDFEDLVRAAVEGR